MRRLYESKIPCYLVDDSVAIDTCFPPEAAMKKGHHRVVRMPSDMRLVASREPTEDVYIDDDGNIFRVYAIEDEAHPVAPMATPAIVGR